MTGFEAAAVTLRSDALRAWEALTMAQKGALRRCHTVVALRLSGGETLEVPLLRLRSDTNARTKGALRSKGAIDNGLHLTELGAVVRKAGLDSEAARARTARARKGLRR